MLALTVRKAEGQDEQPDQKPEICAIGIESVCEPDLQPIVFVPGESRYEVQVRLEQAKQRNQTRLSFPRAQDIFDATKTACLASAVDYRLVYAIGQHESGYIHLAGTFNYWGRKAVGGGWKSWPSLQAAVEDECGYIKTQYLDKGLTTLDQISDRYCYDASDPQGICREWAPAIKKVMESL